MHLKPDLLPESQLQIKISYGKVSEAIDFNGFSIVEVLELCTEHGTKRNELKGNMLVQIAESEEDMELGIIKN